MLIEELRQLIRGEVTADEAMLDAYSTDASIFQVKPAVVTYPRDSRDLCRLVDFVRTRRERKENVSLTARAAGTDMGGGPLNESVIVDFTRHFNRILEIDDTRAVVQPGVFYRDLEKEMETRGVMLPSYPASKNLCTVGGMVANNSGGEKTLRYGKTENYVEELSVVLSDGNEYVFRSLTPKELNGKISLPTAEGEIYRRMHQLLELHHDEIQAARPAVSKNSAGYALWDIWDGRTFDLTKLLVGAQGTLGLITKIKFRLVKKKSHSRLAVVFLKELAPLTALTAKVLEYAPESFESFDDHTFKLAVRFFPGFLKTMKTGLITLLWRFMPEVWMAITGGIPKLVLLIELTSDDEMELSRRASDLLRVLHTFPVKTRLTKNEKEAEKYWTMRRESFNLLRHKIKDKHTAPFIDDFIVRPEYMSEFLPRLNVILDQYADKLVYTIAGHVGDGNFHIIPLMNLADPAARQLIVPLMKKVYALVLEFHGSLTAEHNDGLIRSAYLQDMYGEHICALFTETKNIFDPGRLFNPGKKVDSDINYSIKHIKSA